MQKLSESLESISRYLNNPTNPELKKYITEFRSASEENNNYFLEIEEIWNSSVPASRLEGISASESAKKLRKNLIAHTVPSLGYITWFRSVAATILLAVIGYWFYSQSTELKYLVKRTAENHVDSVKLVDGSTVILAGNSELKYPDKFESETREVLLTKGQAFFKITKDVNHPFKVTINKSNVVVLGTSFNIKLSEAKIELGVKTGRVLFSPYQGEATSILSAGQAISYDVQKRELVSKTSQNKDAWLTKELIFVDTPLEDVCEQLSSYYGTVIKLKNNKPSVKKLNANFKNQSLNDVLIILNETYNIKISKENNQINLITP